MKNAVLDARIPTLVAAVLIVIGVWATSYLTQQGTIFLGTASVSIDPQDVQITNVTDTSFTVSYRTRSAVFGSLVVSKANDNTQTIVLDDRDKQRGNASAYFLHYISVHALIPSTAYFFSIASSDKTFLDNGQPFRITTGPTLDASLALFLAKGKVFSENTGSDKAIVYLKSSSSQTLSTLAKTDGTYNLNFSDIRNGALLSLATIRQASIISLTIIGPSDTSSITILAQQAKSIPPISLTNNYDFSKDDFTLSQPESTPSSSLKFPTSSPSGGRPPQIISPKKNEVFTQTQPLLRGIAAPNETVAIIIQSAAEIKTTLTTDRNGNWSFRPETPLAAGDHIITITTKDGSGIIRTLSQSFSVFAQESVPLITPTQIPLLSPTPSPSPTLIPKPTGTGVLLATPSASAQSSRKGGELAEPGTSYVFPLALFALGLTISSTVLFSLQKTRS
ncbi:MAG: hypothetical protein A3B53_03060 [Candidatus Levybacteria bacterium RIFCSPLOWO2_01_FULL_42_15]|nr:MAG: hypothetical protein A3B53_03060 [Candidatus Levybacteria bacterium RIFCSPLOWO2_01_FULL_42_15]